MGFQITFLTTVAIRLHINEQAHKAQKQMLFVRYFTKAYFPTAHQEHRLWLQGILEARDPRALRLGRILQS